MKRNLFYFVLSGDDAMHWMFSELEGLDDVILEENVFRISQPLLAVLNKLHFSIKINRRLRLPGKQLWKRWYALEALTADPDTVCWIIVTNRSAVRMDKAYLQELSRRENVQLVLLQLDSVNASWVQPQYYTQQLENVDFSLIYSFDADDCRAFGWEYTNTLYSKVKMENNGKPQKDVYFIGLDKGRLGMTRKIYDKLTAAGLSCDFHVIAEKTTDRSIAGGIHLHDRRIPYREVLKGVQNARCILEIVQDGQSGMTLRPYEAMFYNKKLITNNSRLLEMPFYRSDYMQVFSEEEDFPVEFVAEKTDVDYHYAGEYSPVHWLEQMPQDFEEKKRREGAGKHGQN